MTKELPEGQQARISEILDGTAPTEVDQVVAMLDGLQDVMDEFNGRKKNPVASFNRLYRVITEEVAKRLANDGFQDPEFMKTLDLRFAERYFDAVRQWNDRSEWAPQCWSALFDEWHDDDMAPIIGAVAGVTAHIGFDLAAALVRTFKEVGGSILDSSAERIADYNVLNDIFAEQIPTLRRGMLDDNMIAALFDKVTANLDDVVQAETVTAARAAAWDRAKKLWPLWEQPDRYAAEMRSADGWTERVIRTLFFLLDNPLGNYALRDND